MRFLFFFVMLVGFTFFTQAQSQQAQIDSLKREILQMKVDIQEVSFNLDQSRKKFKNGLLIATLGYAVTITGGLMLGRENDDLGKVLLVTGGVTGVTGTAIMLDAFNSLSGRKKKRKH